MPLFSELLFHCQLVNAVAAADKAAVNEQLRKMRIVRKAANPVKQLRVCRYVDAFIRDAARLQALSRVRRKSAPRTGRRSLHEQNDMIILQLLTDTLKRLIFCHGLVL